LPETLNAESLTVGVLQIRPNAYEASLNDRTIELSGTEAGLLHFLMANVDRAVSRYELAQILERKPSTVDVVMATLRRKLGVDFVRNVRGRGWMIDRRRLELGSAGRPERALVRSGLGSLSSPGTGRP
jgi:DNA-binding response OmpR family regulator